MAKKMRTHTQVSEDFLEAVQHKPVIYHFPFPAKVVWAALLDAQAWTEWLPITNVTWTSPAPFQVGTTRVVEIGKVVVEETFFAWEDNQRMAFGFDRSTLPIKAAAEDYRLIETENGCEFQWYGRTATIFPLNTLVNKLGAMGIKKGLPKLEALISREPTRFGHTSKSA